MVCINAKRRMQKCTSTRTSCNELQHLPYLGKLFNEATLRGGSMLNTFLFLLINLGASFLIMGKIILEKYLMIFKLLHKEIVVV